MKIKIKTVKKHGKKVVVIVIKNGDSKMEIALDKLKNIAKSLPEIIEYIKKLPMNEVLNLITNNK